MAVLIRYFQTVRYSPKQLPQSSCPRLLDHLHHLLHLAELLHQAVHILHLRAGTSGDAAAAGGV